jgi:ABC-type glycerol-3-phosphate transport system substrate-binding protein
MWHAYGGALGETFTALVDEFNQSHPNIQVEASYGGNLFTMREKLVTAIAGQAGPDVSQIDQFWSSELADSGALLPIEDFLANDREFARDDIWDKAWETATYSGTVWSMPFALSNIVLYYNRDLFAQAGLDPDQPPANWDELRAAAKKLTIDANGDGTPEQWGLTFPLKANEGNVYYWLAFLWQNGGALLGEDGQTLRFNEPAGVEALQFWLDLAKTDKSLPLSPPENGFETGQVAMTLVSSARLAAMLKAVGPDTLGVAPLPAQKQAATGVGGANLAILSGSRHPQAAWEFIRWMTSPETNLRWSKATGYLPLRQSVIDAADYQAYLQETPQAQVILDQLPAAVVRPNVPAYTPLSREIGLAIEDALFKDVPASAALDAAAR